jgi:hypothetical protein
MELGKPDDIEAMLVAALAKAGSLKALSREIRVSERQVGRWARGECQPRIALLARIHLWLQRP